MRLTCPNCGARYEVDESMIPAAGRDVQCSNCSTTWFQPGPRVEEVAEPTPPPAAPEAPAAPEPEPVDITADDAVEEVEASLSDVVAEATSESEPEVAADGPIRRQIDPEVADILREEAERETELRRADAAPDPVETQDEMPLNSPEENVRAMADGRIGRGGRRL